MLQVKDGGNENYRRLFELSRGSTWRLGFGVRP